jgi:predicted nucleic acid-binding protein
VILVDTSVWIDLFRARRSPQTARLRAILDEGSAFFVTPVVVQEILQGAADEEEFALLHDYLTTQRMVLPADIVRTHCAAARLFFDCRRRGLTPSSAIDCLIAQIAIEHELPLLHSDRDFERIATVAPRLRMA